MTNRWSPRGLAALLERLTGGTALASSTLMAAIVTSSSTVDDDAEWDAAATLAAFTTFGEYADASYGRQAVSGAAIAVDTGGNSDEVYVTFDPTTWPSLALGGNTMAYVVVYLEQSGAAADPALTSRIPVARFVASATPDGSDFTYTYLAGGALRIATAA